MRNGELDWSKGSDNREEEKRGMAITMTMAEAFVRVWGGRVDNAMGGQVVSQYYLRGKKGRRERGKEGERG
jgi:hypothetical protein